MHRKISAAGIRDAAHREGRADAAWRVRRPSLARFAALALAAGLVAACGSSGGSNTSNTQPATTGAGESPTGNASQPATTPTSGELTKVRVGMTNAVGALPVLVAQKEGYFKQHGLDVTAEPVGNLGLIPAALGKTYDVGVTVGPILISAVASGLPLVAISGNEFDSTEVSKASDLNELRIVVPTKIKTPKDLAGKRMATPTLQGNFNLCTKQWLVEQGVDISTVNFVQVANPNMPEQLKAGVVDAAQVQPPFTAQALVDGFHSFGDPCPSIADPIQMTYYIATQNWVNSNKDAAAGYKAALGDAIKWIADHNDEAYQMEADFTKIDINALKQIPLINFSTDYSVEGLKAWGDAMKKYGGFTGNVDYDAMVFKG